jgi:transposase
VNGETDLDKLTERIHPNVKASRDRIKDALEGTLEEEDLIILRLKMRQVADLERTIASVETQIQRHLEPFTAEVELLTTLPGVEFRAAASILAEIGTDMNQFSGGPQLIAWSGLCPANNESGGKKRSARLRKGNRHLKVTMTQVAWAMSRTKQTYLGAKYRALAPRKGKKRAVIAIARKGLLICYHMLKEKKPFYDLGVDYLDSLEPERKVSYHAKRLEELGYDVKITKKVA